MSLKPHRRTALGLLGRAAGIAAGVVADRIVGDPERHHPVAAYGNAVSRAERRWYADSVPRGAVFTVGALAPLAVAGLAVDVATRRHPGWRALTTAVTTWAVVGAQSLSHEGRVMADVLASGDLDAARHRLPHLCGRDPEALDGPQIARGTVESMAENTSDAAVASILWCAVGGLPAMLVHRGSNTLDAMIGHHNDRYENFGKVAAKLDDALNWLPARLTGALAALCAPEVGGNRSHIWATVRAEHDHHPSPNGGWCEAAWAAALAVQLGGRNVYYGNRVEFRPLLGSGPLPDAEAVHDAARLVNLVTGAATLTVVGGLASLAHVLFHGGVVPRSVASRPAHRTARSYRRITARAPRRSVPRSTHRAGRRQS